MTFSDAEKEKVIYEHHFKMTFEVKYYIFQIRIKIKKIAAEIAPSNGAIWDEFREQRYHQSMKKAPVQRLDLYFFNANKVQI